MLRTFTISSYEFNDGCCCEHELNRSGHCILHLQGLFCKEKKKEEFCVFHRNNMYNMFFLHGIINSNSPTNHQAHINSKAPWCWPARLSVDKNNNKQRECPFFKHLISVKVFCRFSYAIIITTTTTTCSSLLNEPNIRPSIEANAIRSNEKIKQIVFVFVGVVQFDYDELSGSEARLQNCLLFSYLAISF